MRRSRFSGNIGAGSYAPQVFTYDSEFDLKTNVIAVGYFDEVGDILKRGDIIIVAINAAPLLLYVLSVVEGVVTTGFVDATL